MIKVHHSEAAFPPDLAMIKDPPKRLFCKGNVDLLTSRCIGVVGSRRMTDYGKRTTESLAYELAAAGITVVSGFMYGIDATAHAAALAADGNTIAVMPCGIERVYPLHQRDLYVRILDSGGLVVSEYSGDEEPRAWTFPKRNRIVAGLSRAVLVVEAAKDSGSLITANLAIEQGRKLFAVPGEINSPTSQGTLRLISDGKADTVVDSAKILGFFGISPTSDKEPIIEAILEEPKTFDDLVLSLKISPAELNQRLTVLLLSGQIVEKEGKYHVGHS